MFWFKNAQIYRLTKEIDFSNIEQALQRCKFTECQASDVSKLGWANPLITSEQLHFSVNGHILILAQKEEKILPTSVIKKETDARISALEEKENRQLKKIEKQAIKEDVIAMLLPKAFSKYQFTPIWIALDSQLVYIDTTSSTRAEESLGLLRKSLGSLPITPISFNKAPCEVMTDWVAKGYTPDWLTLLEEGKLKSFETGSEATFRHQDLETDEVHSLLDAGKLVTKLALDWEDHISFVLSESGVLSKIKFADDVREKNDDILKEDIAQRFDADFLLMTAELGQLVEKLAIAFGGIKEKEVIINDV